MKLSALKVNSARADRGDWIGNLPELGDTQLFVRGYNNPDFQKMLGERTTNVPKSDKVDGRIKPDVMDKIMAECVAKYVFLDWKGFTDDAGNPVPLTDELKMEVLTHADWRIVRDAIAVAARRVEDYQDEKLEQAEGNSASA